MSPIQFHYSSIHARSSDSNGTLDSASHFDCTLKQAFHLKENSKYFIYLNSISIPVDLTCKVNSDEDAFRIKYNTRVATAFHQTHGEKVQKIRKSFETYSYQQQNLISDSVWTLRGELRCLKNFHETLSHCHHLGGECGINTQGMRYFARNIFNRWTTVGKFVRIKTPKYFSSGEEDRTSCIVKLKDSANTADITFGDALGSILGFNEKKVSTDLLTREKNIYLMSDSESAKTPGPKIADSEIKSKAPMGSDEKFVERRSHIYLECSVCEGTNIGGAFRKVLKVIPVMEQFCSGRYLTYDVPFPEYVKIEGNNIQSIRFSLRDSDGEIIESKYTKLPTILTCSLLQE